MTGMQIFEDARVVPRADLAAWLRQLASQLESGGQIFYGAGGTVAVADQVHCELEIERDNDLETSVEIEFTWTGQEAAESAGTSRERVTTEKGEEENEEGEERTGAERAGTPAEAEVTADAGTNITAISESAAEHSAGSAVDPSEEA